MARHLEFLDEELKVVKEQSKTIPGSELVACHRIMVRLKIVKNQHKDITAMIQFPDDYPNVPLLVELKSNTFGYKLLEGLTKMCEEEAKKLLKKQQIMVVLKMIFQFIEDNPLCVCSDEISYIKRELMKDSDKIKLLQKQAQILLKVAEGSYYFTLKCDVPDVYFTSQLQVSISEHNFPEVLSSHFLGQSVEISRRAVKPPLKKGKKDPPFEPKPSLKDIAIFLFKHVKRYPHEICPYCKELLLPEDPKTLATDPADPKFIERVYCTHLYHHGCLDVYFKTPPFTGGKKCMECGQRIYHNKWKITPELAEARWAHKEARQRELDEVVDFLQ
ncbi:uncharacterized protein LOC135488059 [Lineus longissimus]|uniref:uncharacterized protein LOC135488059 n=1 Tax=Lineus longissimus TaxID=88925 RepID=UPI002B4DCBA6